MSRENARDTIHCSECRREPTENEDAMNSWRTRAADKVFYFFCPTCWTDQGQKSTRSLAASVSSG
jgi:hypothetical protein